MIKTVQLPLSFSVYLKKVEKCQNISIYLFGGCLFLCFGESIKKTSLILGKLPELSYPQEYLYKEMKKEKDLKRCVGREDSCIATFFWKLNSSFLQYAFIILGNVFTLVTFTGPNHFILLLSISPEVMLLLDCFLFCLFM